MTRWLSLLLLPPLAALLLAEPAPAPVPAVPTPADAVLASLLDVQSRPAAERPYLRYLVLAHMVDGKARQEMWQVVSGHVNGTSRERLISRPAVILAPAKAGGPLEVADGLEIKAADWDRAVLIRLNIGYYLWKREVYEALALVEPHYHFREKKVASIDIVGGKTEKKPAMNLDTATVMNAPKASTPISLHPGPKWRYRYKHTFRDGSYIWRVSWDGCSWYDDPQPPAHVPVVKPKPKAPVVPPHGAWLPAKEITALALETVSDVPLVNADFFYWQTGIQNDRAPGPGYYDLLGGIKNQQDFFELIGFDPKQFARQFRDYLVEYRAAIGKSGIAYQPRRIVAFDKPGGWLWATFDNRLALLDRNPLETPDDTFQFDATEQYGHLSNGLWAFYLGNAAGVAQNNAPDFIGHDSTSTSRLARIEIGKSCISCHTNGGLQDFKDWYRNQFTPPVRLDSPIFKEARDVQRLYFISINDKLQPGRLRYAAALKDATGLTPQEYARVVSNRWKEYADAPTAVNMARAAREVGTTPANLQAAWRGFKLSLPGPLGEDYGSLRGYFAPDMFLRPEKEQEPLQLEIWNESITDVHKALAGARP